MNEISKAIYTRESTSVEKFDYFVCSVAGALFAYVGQTYTPHKLDTSFSMLMPVALAYLTLCFFFAFRRIQLANIGIKLNKDVIKENQDCIHITEQLNAHAASKVPVKIIDSATGKDTTPKLLSERRDKKLAKMKEMEKLARRKIKWANSFEYFRDICLLLAFLMIIAAKILQPYIKP
jgi:hypothetical protein